MSTKNNPYRKLSERAFWRKAISARHFLDIEDVCEPIQLSLEDKIATAGSCFAQHIRHHLRANGANYLDLEPKPNFLPDEKEKLYGYGIYSCRYGNIYTARQLLQLFEEAMGLRTPMDSVWEMKGRYFDALRPSVDPVGQPSLQAVAQARTVHLKRVREMFETLDVFLFTLGLTEAWIAKEDGTVYPTVPGSIAGTFDPDKYIFRNFRYPEILDDLNAFWKGVKTLNAAARMLLTVSPVPLVATASGHHVLPATIRSKSVLRAVAGDLAEDCEEIFYFPSYELIASHPTRGTFFDPDLRNVNKVGVQIVMKHFFQSFGEKRENFEEFVEEFVCDEEIAIDRVQAE